LDGVAPGPELGRLFPGQSHQRAGDGGEQRNVVTHLTVVLKRQLKLPTQRVGIGSGIARLQVQQGADEFFEPRPQGPRDHDRLDPRQAGQNIPIADPLDQGLERLARIVFVVPGHARRQVIRRRRRVGHPAR
jgi:hypothetical protein